MDRPSLLFDLVTPVATLTGVGLTLWQTGRREAKRLGQQLAFQREKLALGLTDARQARLHDQRVELVSKFFDRFEPSWCYRRVAMADAVSRIELSPLKNLRRQSREVGIRVLLLAPAFCEAVSKARTELLVVGASSVQLSDNGSPGS